MSISSRSATVCAIRKDEIKKGEAKDSGAPFLYENGTAGFIKDGSERMKNDHKYVK